MTEFSKWYEAAYPKAGKIAKSIFENYCQRINEEHPAISPDFLKKVILTYLFPYRIFQESAFALPGMYEAVVVLRQVFDKCRRYKDGKICLFADSDADGILAASLFYIFLRDIISLKEDQIVFLTPGFDDKFGIGDNFVKKILEINPELLITFDCGSTDAKALEIIKETTKAKIIVVDHHHLPQDKRDFPPVDVFLNSKLCHKESAASYLSSSALAYKLIRGYFYSYSSFFGKVYEVWENDQKVYVKDGLIIENPPSEVISVSWDNSKTQIVLKNIWEKESRHQAELFDIRQFGEKMPTAISMADKFLLLQEALQKKTEVMTRFSVVMAAIGVVADLVPLWLDNRIMVAQALRLLSQLKEGIPLGLRELLRRLDILHPYIQQDDFAFSLCPTINSADRMGNPQLAFRCLIEKDPLKAAKLAYELFELNQKRKTVFKQALALLHEGTIIENERLVIAYHREIHRGISGLLASRLAQEYRRPAMVLVHDGDSLRGSVRSYRHEDIFTFIARFKDRFLQFGGHSQAAGFSLAYSEKDNFMKEIYEQVEHLVTQGPIDREENLALQIYIMDHELDHGLWSELFLFSPYGQKNPKPELVLTNTLPFQVHFMGEEKNHAKITFSAFPELDALWFFAADEAKELKEYLSYEWYGEPLWDYFNGKLKYVLKIKKVKLKESSITHE